MVSTLIGAEPWASTSVSSALERTLDHTCTGCSWWFEYCCLKWWIYLKHVAFTIITGREGMAPRSESNRGKWFPLLYPFTLLMLIMHLLWFLVSGNVFRPNTHLLPFLASFSSSLNGHLFTSVLSSYWKLCILSLPLSLEFPILQFMLCFTPYQSLFYKTENFTHLVWRVHSKLT